MSDALLEPAAAGPTRAIQAPAAAPGPEARLQPLNTLRLALRRSDVVVSFAAALGYGAPCWTSRSGSWDGQPKPSRGDHAPWVAGNTPGYRAAAERPVEVDDQQLQARPKTLKRPLRRAW